MKILITGGAGFIGSHLCDALMERGHNLTVVDNLVLGRKENISHLLGKLFSDASLRAERPSRFRPFHGTRTAHCRECDAGSSRRGQRRCECFSGTLCRALRGSRGQ